jgi:ABC-2 type transport system permease protein
MFTTFFKFELKNWLRAPMPWIFLLVLGIFAFGGTISDNVTIGESSGNAWKNSPYMAQLWYGVFSFLTLLLVTSFLNSAALRDFERQTAQIIFASPISKAAYYFGHFAGAVVIALIPMLGVLAGMGVAVALNPVFEWIDPERLGPWNMMGHVDGFIALVIPNILFSGGILFTVAALTRSSTYAFVAGAGLLVAYIVSGNLTSDLDNEQLAALLDPFGLEAFSLVTKYWTVEEKNHQSVSLFHPIILANRLLWMAVGLAVLTWGYFRFTFTEGRRSGRRRSKEVRAESEPAALRALGVLPRVTPLSGWGVTLRQLGSQLRTDFRGMIKSTPFLILTLLGLFIYCINLRYVTESYGTHNFPVTIDMIDLLRGSFYVFIIAIVAYFTGALVWKERNARVNEIFDALPTRNWTALAAKYLTVVAVVFLLELTGVFTSVIAQALHGYTRFELDVYVRELLLIDLSKFAFIAALSMLVHVLSPNMYLGFFITVAFLISNNFVWQALSVLTNMVQFGSRPTYVTSDFYGYQPYSRGLIWFSVYWGLFCLFLGIVAACLWRRGTETNLALRLRQARMEWRHYRWAGLGALVAWIVSAGFVFYNTKVVNTYRSDKEEENLAVRYERDYKRFENAPQPRIFDVEYAIDIFPETRRVDATGRFRLRNPYGRAIDTLFVQQPDRIKFSLENARLQLLHSDPGVNVALYRIEPALAPGDSMLLEFRSVYHAQGFENELSMQEVLSNGTFFNNTQFSPSFGYQAGNELTDKNKRKKHGLPERSPMPPFNLADSVQRRNIYFANDGDWVNVRTVVSTSADQLAVAPGSLLREWNENGRRYFEYRLDHKSWNFYSFISARYEVARREWNGIQLEVYYHKDHAYNVERMLKAMQKSLEYYTTHFGPYYHKQCRIIEFPRYASFAQAFPGTMPYSEGIGFIENFRPEEDDIDMVFYVVAHEMGHQWWAHQECGANMQGAEMTTETFAQYSALMVMEHEYGRDQMRKFLRYEMDKYLSGRSRERHKEQPLAKCEGQPYIYYNKGSTVMYYLKEMIGEDRVNAALRSFLERYRYKDAPYPVSSDATGEFYAQTPDSLKYIIDDLFWDITLFENRTTKTSLRDLPGGKYEVTIDVECRKLKAGDQGQETEVPLNDWIEIGAFARPEGDRKYGKTLYRQRVKIERPVSTFTFVVDEKPHQAGVDPFSLLVDRDPKDNLKGF